MKINSYHSASGTDLIDKYIQELTLEEQIDAYDVLKQLEDGKTETLQIKKWQGKIQEVYFYKHNRIFYVVADQENIYLLHACRKQKNKTEKNDARQIKKRAKELSKIIKKKLFRRRWEICRSNKLILMRELKREPPRTLHSQRHGRPVGMNMNCYMKSHESEKNRI